MATRQQAAKEFAEFWQGKGYEKGQSQPFWLSLLRDVYGVEHPERYITFEDQVHLDHTSFIDGYIASTRVMIEQKGLGKNLNQPIRQSDGSFLTPFQQAKRYIVELPVDMHPRYVVTCNFEEFWVYDMNKPTGDPEKILLKDLEKEYYRLEFMVDKDNDHLQEELEVSVKAGELVGEIYDAFARFYKDNMTEEDMRNLNVLCVRLVFCLYAENSGLFGKYAIFHDYMEKHTERSRIALEELFNVLNTDEPYRKKHLRDDDAILASFPYVNGGLFADEEVDIPGFDEDVHKLLLEKASAGFNWADISPTIFGAVFESTLNPETRRAGGMHYTSIENIHKVIDPLFLDDLKAEFKDICAIGIHNRRQSALRAFQTKLASLTFLDPACGSGNFLTESYISLRRLENSVLRELSADGQISIGGEFSPVQVSLSQFYGIEINDFAVSVARTALWIAEHQMLRETSTIVGTNLNFLPLKSYTNIVEGNALRLDWESVVPKEKLNYIMGNPPFVGGMMMTREQKAEFTEVVGNVRGVGEMDYVVAWYYKAVRLMKDTSIRAALVSTNSICQGQQAVTVWKSLMRDIHIDFAYRTFRWDSESNSKAHVHCVIVGFSCAPSNKPKVIYYGDRKQIAENINAYLLDADNVFIDSHSSPICDVPPMRFGSMPRDGGGFILSEQEKEELLKKEPQAEKWLHRYIGAEDFINNKVRWCLWLVGISPAELRSMPEVLRRVEFVRQFRLNSVAAATRKFAETPTLFCQIAQPDTDYILVPRVSSERRRYVPMGFKSVEDIASDATQIIPDASLYHFGILTSNIHNGWMRAVCGRLEMRYRYSKDIVYNNFPWPTPTEEQKAKIEQTAQAILDARAIYPDSSLADLYDETSMPPELRKAHQDNDRAVMAAYGWTKNHPAYSSESACVAELMKMYQELVHA